MSIQERYQRPEEIADITERVAWLYRWLDARLDVLPYAFGMLQENAEYANNFRSTFRSDPYDLACAESSLRAMFDEYLDLVTDGMICLPSDTPVRSGEQDDYCEQR